MLREWEANNGEVAVFRWVEWLRESALAEALGGEEALLLDATGAGDECAPRDGTHPIPSPQRCRVTPSGNAPPQRRRLGAGRQQRGIVHQRGGRGLRPGGRSLLPHGAFAQPLPPLPAWTRPDADRLEDPAQPRLPRMCVAAGPQAHNAEATREEFFSEPHSCMACFDTVPGAPSPRPEAHASQARRWFVDRAARKLTH